MVLTDGREVELSARVVESVRTLYRRGTGCWMWLGRTSSRGSARHSVTVRGRSIEVPARRIVWRLETGWSDAEPIYTTCHTVGCVRPDHATYAASPIDLDNLPVVTIDDLDVVDLDAIRPSEPPLKGHP